MGVWVQNGGKLEEVTLPSTTSLLEGEKQPALMLRESHLNTRFTWKHSWCVFSPVHYENQYYIQSAGGQEEVLADSDLPRRLGFSPSFFLGEPQVQVGLSFRFMTLLVVASVCSPFHVQ